MDHSDIRELMPLYVAGTLDAGQRRLVEQALAEHSELQEDLAFWQGARQTTSQQVRWGQAGHVATHQLVDYAEGRLSDAEAKRAISDHLDTCATCGEIYKMLSATLDTAPVSRLNPSTKPSLATQFREWIAGVSKVLRAPRLLAPVAVLLLVALFALNPDRGGDSAGLSFRIKYQPQSRSVPQIDLPVLDIDTDHQTVTLEIEVPAPGVAGVDYRVALSDSTRRWWMLGEQVASSESGMMVVRVNLRPKDDFPSDGLYYLRVNEVLADETAAMGLTPQEYNLPFRVTGRGDGGAKGQ